MDFIPARDKLNRIVQIVHRARLAYPIDELAHQFLAKPESILVKMTVRKEAEADFALYECRPSGAVFTDRAEAEAFLINEDMLKHFDVEEIEVAAPTGAFAGVMRCTRSGTLLGPPNHHTYTEACDQCRQDKFPHLSRDQFMKQVEMVRDEEVVEQWRKSLSVEKRFRLKPPAEKPEKAQKGKKKKAAAAASETPAAPEEETSSEVPAQAEAELNEAGSAVEGTSPEAPAPETAPESAPAVEASPVETPAGSPDEAAAEAPSEEPAPEAPTPTVDERPTLTLKEAEKLYRDQFLSRQLVETHRCIAAAHWLFNESKSDLAAQVTGIYQKELNQPFSILLALRPALKHMKCHIFKQGERIYVSGVMPHPVSPDQFTDELKAVLLHILEHPSCTREELLEALKPGETLESQAGIHLTTQLHWLVEKGHIIQFHDGKLIAPTK